MIDADTLRCLQLAAAAATDKKAFQLVAMDVSELTSLADSFLLCSAASDRQVDAIVNSIERRMRDEGRRPLSVEGESKSEWVLLDFGEVVIHVFTEEKRSYYNLDSLWGDAPRLGAEQLGLDEGGEDV